MMEARLQSGISGSKRIILPKIEIKESVFAVFVKKLSAISAISAGPK